MVFCPSTREAVDNVSSQHGLSAARDCCESRKLDFTSLHKNKNNNIPVKDLRSTLIDTIARSCGCLLSWSHNRDITIETVGIRLSSTPL